jgi:hypothetical protein
MAPGQNAADVSPMPTASFLWLLLALIQYQFALVNANQFRPRVIVGTEISYHG